MLSSSNGISLVVCPSNIDSAAVCLSVGGKISAIDSSLVIRHRSSSTVVNHGGRRCRPTETFRGNYAHDITPKDSHLHMLLSIIDTYTIFLRAEGRHPITMVHGPPSYQIFERVVESSIENNTNLEVVLILFDSVCDDC